MNEHLLKMAAAFAVGTGATAGMLRLLDFLPVPGYVKRALGIVVPLPVILVALVMMYYGPGAAPDGNEAAPASAGELRKMFFWGVIAALAYLMLATLVRFVLAKSDGDEE